MNITIKDSTKQPESVKTLTFDEIKQREGVFRCVSGAYEHSRIVVIPHSADSSRAPVVMYVNLKHNVVEPATDAWEGRKFVKTDEVFTMEFLNAPSLPAPVQEA
jgi:hypothetical protein